jgi:hypothetical protein
MDGIIYVAKSAKQNLYKIGTTQNLDKRKETLRSQSYAGADDWVFVYHTKSERAGQVEKLAQSSLASYKILGVSYERSGITQVADEIFRCSTNMAINAVKKAVNGGQ